MNERVKFMGKYFEEELSLSELCRYFGISRTTAYKWIDRYEADGVRALEDQSRAPHHHPNEVKVAVKEAILAARRKHTVPHPQGGRSILGLRRKDPNGFVWSSIRYFSYENQTS